LGTEVDKKRKKREIPITSQAQRALLEQAKAFARSGNLTPAENIYKQQLDTVNLEW